MTRLAILLFVFAWALATAPAQAQECAEPVSTGRVTAQVEEIENAWASRRREGIAAGLADLLADLECVRTPLSPQLVARVHRARGLAFVVEGDSEAAARAFFAARTADPNLGMSDALAPPGTPVQQLYVRPAPELVPLPLPPPRRGRFLLDGHDADTRPANRPQVLQHVLREGQVKHTWWLDAGEELPQAPWDDPHRDARLGLRLGGLGATAVGLALLGGAALTAEAHANPNVPRTKDELETLRDRSRALTITGGTLTVLGAGSVGVSFSGTLQ